MLVVVVDGWVPDKYFEDDERAKAHEYVRRCNYLYQGTYELKPCSDDYPRRFDKALEGGDDATE